MRIIINGIESEFTENLTVYDIVVQNKLPGNIIIEHNGDIIRKEFWEKVLVNPGDKLELIHIIGGG